ncbi:UNVERIFIED_CONTAM: hypothetical protein Sindi_2280500 [Sesamum indicum]
MDRHNDLLLLLERCYRWALAKVTKLERRWFRNLSLIIGLSKAREGHSVYGFRISHPWERYLLTEEDGCKLTKLMTPDEVKLAIFYIAEDKAPGPDSYSSGFCKASWSVVGKEVTQAIFQFFSMGKLLKQVNSTLLSLIPKVHNPTLVVDFRPILCCNILYKAITKIIVQRLSNVLDKIISPSQSAFVPGHSIGDNILLAQELFIGYNQQRLPPRCALKVDLHKAYDTVEWDFLTAVLRMFGFPPLFVQWIDKCLTTMPFSMGLDRFATLSGLRVSKQKSHLIISRSAQRYRDQLLEIQNIKFVLMALSISWVSAFILPKGIIREIAKCLWSFICKGTSTSGYAKVTWKDVYWPVLEGGQGLRDVPTLNHALMCKYLCELIRCDRTSIWVEWICHFLLHERSTAAERGGLWGWRKLPRLRPLLRPLIEYRIGDGASFSLWHDPWHSMGPFILLFPRAPSLTNMLTSASLNSVIVDGQWCWPVITTSRSFISSPFIPARAQDCPHWTSYGFLTWASPVSSAMMILWRRIATLSFDVAIPRIAWLRFDVICRFLGLTDLALQMLHGLRRDGEGNTSIMQPTKLYLLL